jgi:hypothetical protein
LIAALIGVALGIVVILFARTIRGEGWLYSIGLLTLPSLYAFFALRVGDQTVGLNEMIYGIPFLAAGLIFAFVSVRQSAVVIGSLWILHALYDVTHDQFITNPGVPRWYPAFCFCVDVVIGAYLLWLSRRVAKRTRDLPARLDLQA